MAAPATRVHADFYDTRWGAVVRPDGATRFRLWAPDEPAIGLRLGAAEQPMQRRADGWHECVVPRATAGTPYAFVLADGTAVPDPASRAQAGDVHGPSLLVDPTSYRWRDAGWRTRPWEQSVYYELHIGAFTPEGSYAAAIDRLEHLARLGVTTIELMPVAQFAGRRGWGYDGVLLYAPHNAYGPPEVLKALVDAAHAHGLNIVLDVVYNHFGPEGNYLPRYAPQFFHAERRTPWGTAIAYEAPAVRQFIIDNALYWLVEFHFDGLRLDAVDHIRDPASDPELLVELARTVRETLPDRTLHLTTEDNRNIVRLHERDADGRPRLYSGEWNDDFHNAAHVIATGETEGYYRDFAEDRWHKLARCLAEGFAFQGEPSPNAGGAPRGAPSAALPPTAFIDFIQNHDQVGNRAFGERLNGLAGRDMVETLLAMLLLSPHIPLLFMGQEWDETRPFAFFADFKGALAAETRRGRRREFAHFAAFSNDAQRLREVPDPNAPGTFAASRLDWSRADTADGGRRLALTHRLLALRAAHIVPLLARAGPNAGRIERAEAGLVGVSWRLGGSRLSMLCNLGTDPAAAEPPPGRLIYASASLANGHLPAPAILVTLAGG